MNLKHLLMPTSTGARASSVVLAATLFWGRVGTRMGIDRIAKGLGNCRVSRGCSPLWLARAGWLSGCCF